MAATSRVRVRVPVEALFLFDRHDTDRDSPPGGRPDIPHHSSTPMEVLP
jgi:hypothetical protein